uniref:Uncharacterized protein LOC108950884 n=1 Tax=Phallusia mammillata TaxID=59560 RepID=A0A6F9DK45_9ASCI|nr:uncharacterized protein LOC108950884 [Phallusia mammillata]
MCSGAKDAHRTYQKHGKCSEACKPDGKGGLWANQVYELNFQWIKHENWEQN